MDQLRPFASNEWTEPFQVLADLVWGQDSLQIRYRIQGPIEQLIMPQIVGNPQFRDELWTTTCLEIFLQETGQSAYEEWNFSPSGNWAYYAFDSYRQRRAQEVRQEPLEPLSFIRNEHQWLLQVRIPLLTANVDYGLTAVLHPKLGDKQYWALAHKGERPDFHRAESFVGKSRPG